MNKKTILKIWNLAVDLICPRKCPVCDEVVPTGAYCCMECRDTFHVIKEDFCMRCGKAIPANMEYCKDCGNQSHLYIRGRVLYRYEGELKNSIYRFKYGHRVEYADFYAKQTKEYLDEFITQTNAQGLVPVPLHKKKQRQRGYNQAYKYAKALSKEVGIPVYEDYVLRVKNTAPQKKFDALGRQNNLKKAFKIGRNDVKLKIIILIDDIYTTGSTIDAVTKVLLEAGVDRVYFVALAGGIQ